MQDQITRYARLLIQIGVNLQPGQPLKINAELGHRDFVRTVTALAYQAGALFVDVMWNDPLVARARFEHSADAGLDYAPEYFTARARESLDRRYAVLSLTGEEYPDAFDGIDPARMRRSRLASYARVSFYSEALMADAVQWCVAAVPTVPWATRLFPGLSEAEAVARLWGHIFATTRLNEPDPIAAWRAHDQRLGNIARALERADIRALHFVDPTPGPDGKPSTDLTVGLTDRPAWVAAASHTPEGTRFLPNMPTEEIFSTPHRDRVNGHVRTSKPVRIMEQEVRDAWMRFADGVVVDFGAAHGEAALRQMFEIEGARSLGEVALVDVDSPINRSGLIFGDTLFDENAACHIAFGKAYPLGIQGGKTMDAEALKALGMNDAKNHDDVMIGTETMSVTGISAAGQRIPVMVNGKFVLG